ncbi:hypothetical protein EIN_066070 [Entamoeba invadens IP1]|uniref:Uncharacterized protein n=1 Tax=Entamoeba invadens IP1 TaxID=370355 RepID=A0A0A1TVD0_ENTIV|nr:hypothetical protein EIN_066070 [Entamoeba invadens IP1]ELP84322.1 hypothetical protein EIN_066070 [Entamoeba invadens IP1]|eukprot:XP_004183668.1 hypothetical protein EIN_066070 [Entamoeba invadens IP1]
MSRSPTKFAKSDYQGRSDGPKKGFYTMDDIRGMPEKSNSPMKYSPKTSPAPRDQQRPKKVCRIPEREDNRTYRTEFITATPKEEEIFRMYKAKKAVANDSFVRDYLNVINDTPASTTKQYIFEFKNSLEFQKKKAAIEA